MFQPIRESLIRVADSETWYKGVLRPNDVAEAHLAANRIWGHLPAVMDPMAGGGSIPLESVRLGFPTLANEYNPVACSVLEATLDYPLRFGPQIAERARHWGREWEKRVAVRLERFFPKEVGATVHAYIFARTVPCPTTTFMTPLVPDWHVLKPKSGIPVVAVPVVDKKAGTWTTEIRPVGIGPGNVVSPPPRTYAKGRGISLFTGESIPGDWIKALAQAGKMGNALYAVALKTPQGLKFRPPLQTDLDALASAKDQLAQWRGDWETKNLIPTEEYPEISSDLRPWSYGMPHWADMFSPRQLLGFGVLMEELQALRPEILALEGSERGEVVVHLLAFVIDKLANWNSILSTWNVNAQTVRSVFDRHDFSFKFTFSEMAPVVASGGLAWALDNVCSAYDEVAKLPRAETPRSVELSHGSATSLIHLADHSIDAIVVDPPYSDNVQYSELADFFYVWLKRSQGHRRPEWFSSLLCENSEEAVKNDARFRAIGRTGKAAGVAAQAQYQDRMTRVFAEAHRLLRPDGVLTVMFTHKKQEAWEALFASLNILSAADRRRDAPLREEEAQQLLFGTIQGTGKKAKKSDALKIHPRDPVFRTHLDRAQALALAYADAGGGAAGIGAARALANRHGVKAGDPTVRLIEALLKASPLALRRDKGAAALKFPEFRAWHAMLQPLFGITPPDWAEKGPDQGMLALLAAKGTAVAEEEIELAAEEEEEEEGDSEQDEDDAE